MITKMIITDYISENPKSSPKTVYPIRFIPHDGYYPLVLIPSLYRDNNNLYFSNMQRKHIGSRIHNRISLESGGFTFRYRMGRAINAPVGNLYSGFLSMMGVKEDFDYMASSLLYGEDKMYRMKGDLDVFCLGVIELAHLPQVKFNVPKQSRYVNRRYMEVEMDLTKVKILVSEEKLRKSLFAKHYYTTTVRKELLHKIEKLNNDTAITVKDVPDDYIEKFIISPNTVRTKSMAKVIQIDNEIKDSVFSNLNTVAI